MNRAQELQVARIRQLTEKDLLMSGRYEVKKFDVTEYDKFIALYIETGMEGDDGTLAEIFCRYTAHLFIGRRGGITYPVHKPNRNGDWRMYNKPFKGNLFRVYRDQNKRLTSS